MVLTSVKPRIRQSSAYFFTCEGFAVTGGSSSENTSNMSRLGRKFYFRSIHKRWIDEVSKATRRVIVFSPYVTSSLAESVLTKADPRILKLYTTVCLETFASGGSSVVSLLNLCEAGYKIFETPLLHAKLILVDDHFATIGSQNLTSNAVRNAEATAVFTEPNEVSHIAGLVETWIKASTPVSRELLSSFKDQIPNAIRQYRKMKRAAVLLEHELREADATRQRKEVAEKARQRLEEFKGNPQVSLKVARYFISKSAWWLTHRHRPTRAPKFANHVRQSKHGWAVDFGLNCFLVEKAIKRCNALVEKYISDYIDGQPFSEVKLREDLRKATARSVANSRDEEFNGLYPIKKNDLVFGAQSIDVKDFSDVFLERLKSLQPHAIEQPPKQIT